jgi:hypothetical protein
MSDSVDCDLMWSHVFITLSTHLHTSASPYLSVSPSTMSPYLSASPSTMSPKTWTHQVDNFKEAQVQQVIKGWLAGRV